MRVAPLTWLIVTTVADPKGEELVLLGRATYDGPADLLTVTTREGQREEAPLHRRDPQAFAKTLLQSLFNRTKESDQ